MSDTQDTQRLALALEAENARLTRERDEAVAKYMTWESEELQRRGEGWEVAVSHLAAREAELREAREALERVMSVTLQHEPMDLTAQGWLGDARAFLARPSSTAALQAFGERVVDRVAKMFHSTDKPSKSGRPSLLLRGDSAAKRIERSKAAIVACELGQPEGERT